MGKGHWCVDQVTEFSTPRVIPKCLDLAGQPPQPPMATSVYGGLNVRGCHD